MKLYAVTDKDGNIMIAYPATQFHNEQSLTLKELHTYDPASQVVVDREVYDQLYKIVEREKCVGWYPDQVYVGWHPDKSYWDAIDKFLSAGKEAT